MHTDLTTIPLASDNPQTYSQALLLIAKMARFASESIIHTVMPIFTFIDKNVIHRDDEYSFRVIQQVRTLVNPLLSDSCLILLVGYQQHRPHYDFALLSKSRRQSRSVYR
jgi:hypothetical protein